MTRETGLPPNCDDNPDFEDIFFAFVLGFAWLSPTYALDSGFDSD